MSLRLLLLDSRGSDYARDQLQNGWELAQELLGKVSFAAGSLYAVLPNQAIGDVYEFEQALHRGIVHERIPVEGGYMEPIPSTAAEMASWLWKVMQQNPRWVLISEAFNLGRSHIPASVLQDPQQAVYLPGRTQTRGDRVYHLAVATDPQATVEIILRSALERPVGLAVIFEPPPSWIVPPAERVSEFVRSEDVSENVRLLLLSAYDGESMLAWIPTSTSLQSPEHFDALSPEAPLRDV